MSRNQLRKLHARRTRWMLRAQRRDRRGVLLMVVLSMLALFLLLGTAFLVSSRFYATTGKEAGKLNRTTNNPADLMERAMLQVLRDTNNPSSSIRYHSLLRDVYGSDGFIAEVMVPENARRDLMAQYSGASLPSAGSLTTPPLLGHTQGQFIDLYVVDPLALPGELPDSQHVIKLERSPTGFTVDHDLETAKNYHAGCILTMLAGPAAGQSTRIISSQVVDYVQQPTPNGNSPRPIVRLRVMAFPASNGAAMTPGKSSVAARDVELLDVAGYAFMVNGRANSGTGAGLNRLAQRGAAKLSTVEVQLDQGGNPLDMHEVALTPNYRFFPSGLSQYHPTTGVSMIGSNHPTAGFQPFGNFGQGQNLYPTAEGPGGSNESYDAVDYQNMFLAHMPVSPRATASLIDANGVQVELGDTNGVQLMINNAQVAMRPDMENTIVPSFHQPALINYWYQRLHDAPWLANQLTDENVRAATILAPYGANGLTGVGTPINDQIAGIKRKISLRPIREDHPSFDGGNAASTYSGTLSPTGTRQRLSVNNDIRFPAWEVVGPWDVDNDNDGINDSVWVDLGDPVQETENGTLYKPLYAFLIVDLDNRLNVNAHGSPDHFAAAQLDALNRASDNNNIFGDGNQELGNLAAGDQRRLGVPTMLWSSEVMPHGMGWGPGDINLRSILSPLTQPYSPAFLSNYGDPRIAPGSPVYDDYARLFFGRLAADPGSDANWGRMGSINAAPTLGPGRNLNSADVNSVNASREPSLAFEFVGFPVVDHLRAQQQYNSTGDPNLIPYLAPSAFATTPDLRGRYALGVDYTGQPVFESSYDGYGNYIGRSLTPLVDESPYETYLSKDGRRGVPDEQTTRAALASFGTTGIAVNDDALFATSELERLLRRYDPETGTAPSRLLDIVDAFDPVKYASTINIGSAEQNLAYAQTVTGINSRQVTTDSYEIPTPSDVVPSYITELGPDGAPGIVGQDDDGQDSDGNGEPIDDAVPFNPQTGMGEIGFFRVDSNNPLFMSAWSDDFASYTGKSVAEARFVDVVWYRIQRAREKRQLPIYNWNNPDAVAILNNICDQLLPPEVLAGYKMDINRPFGDGRDNNGNGIVDEPLEGGEPWLDTDGNGIWENEPFIDLDGDGRFYADANGDDVWNPIDPNDKSDYVDVNNDGVLEPLVDNLWASQLGGTAALLNSTMGKDVTGRTVTPDGILRDDAHLARQLYARHLYMLMMVLMDEDYLAPYDPADPSGRAYLRVKSILLRVNTQPPINAYQAKLEAHRRYTCRQIAQWAINCVDFRDSDSTNTPFEYDEYPWDGWGTVTDGGTLDDLTDDTYFPLDGDPATDENHAQYIDWANMGVNGAKVITNPTPRYGAGGNQIRDDNATRGLVWGAERPELLISETLAFHDMRQEDRATTADEGDNTTAPTQDTNRPQDDDLDQRLEPRGSLYVEVYNPNSGDAPKPVELYRHADYRLFPVDRNGDGDINELDSFSFADINNNGRYDQGTDQIVEGVLLDRLSDRAHTDELGIVRRSPVWRIIVVEEHPAYHPYESGTDTVDVPGITSRDPATSHVGNLVPPPTAEDGTPTPLMDYHRAIMGVAQVAQRPWLAPMNMDWDEMFFIPPWTTADFSNVQQPWKMSTWQQRKTGSETRPANSPKNEQVRDLTREMFSKPYPYIEREMYFTSGDTPFFSHTRELESGNSRATPGSVQRSYHDLDKGPLLRKYYEDLRVRIPLNYIDLGTQTLVSGSGTVDLVSMPHRFVATQQAVGRRDVRIAPIMPGRYGVIGEAGTVYPTDRVPAASGGRTRYITTIGRNLLTANGGAEPQNETTDADHLGAILGTRRIELQPSTNPFVQQLLVGANGGIPGATDGDRAGELMTLRNLANRNQQSQSDVVNITAETADPPTASAGSQILAPVVAIPVDDMNISEPAYGYGVRARELFYLESGSGDEGQEWKPEAANGEGAFVNVIDGTESPAHFDTPFDVDPEFDEAEKTPKFLPKFRVVHLQRLADPTLPWNPPPGYLAASDDPTKKNFTHHDARWPVNPYLTVDSTAVDLTVFNGASSSQAQAGSYDGFYSRERTSQLRRTVGNAAEFPQRWTLNQDTFLALRAAGLPNEGRAPTMRSRIFPNAVQTDHAISENHFDYFFGHSLGLPNQSLGATYLRPETGLAANMIDPTDVVGDDLGNQQQAQTMGPALGAPRPDQATGVTSTAPWMTWNNRPFVSESELLQVPAWSSMELLRKFSGLDSAKAGQTAAMNDYNPGPAFRTGNASSPIDGERTNAERYKRMTAGFGHLINLKQVSRDPAYIEPDSNGNPACVGAANFHRILDYVHTPSRFVATDTLLNPVAFSAAGVTSPDDPRSGMAAPFNRVPDYREPGKVNLNTVVSQRGPSMAPANPAGIAVWSDVFDGLMHRVRDQDPIAYNQPGYGHMGPAWKDIVWSRRGYTDPVLAHHASGVDRVDLVLNNNVPSFFGNPFRSSEAGDLVPLASMVDDGVAASMLRAHPVRPGANFQWGAPGVDNNGNGLVSDTREAGWPTSDDVPLVTGTPTPEVAVPLFSELTSTPGVDAPRNSAMHYMPLTRIDNLTTTRSGVFAVWVTVGYFEVLPAPNWDADENNVQQKFRNQTGDTADPPLRARALYDKVYPQGYQLGKELKSETGDVDRHRSFYIIDRTRPVAFKPGEDVNVEDAILLRRRID
ncbi:hypothetical protein [Aeoliella sp. SH292]|uniref:hypothetical protein n=1 Tax=Aeoliella sp. SH292 TaxID=3454464 RepID=UPI003F9A2EF0